MLANNQVVALRNAITGYAFPCACYDFINNTPNHQPNMLAVENLIRVDLTSGNTSSVKNGLSNVLYWGYARIGFRDFRLARFRTKVTVEKLMISATLFQNIVGDGLMQIKAIGLSEFSGMSFISKVRMFLDPENYVIFDKQILKMNQIQVPTVLSEISFAQTETRIRVSGPNVKVYNNWCRKCTSISKTYFGGQYRAVDVERGFFTLIQGGNTQLAAAILSAA